MFIPGFCFCLWGMVQLSQLAENGTSPTGGSVIDYLFPHSGFGAGGAF